MLSDALLPEHHRSLRIELDRQRDDQQERSGKDQSDGGDRNIHDALAQHRKSQSLEAVAEDQRTRIQPRQGNLAAQLFIKRDAVLDRNAVRLAVEQLVGRQGPSPLGQGDDDALHAASRQNVLDAVAIFAVHGLDVPHEPIPGPGVRLKPGDDGGGERATSQHQDPRRHVHLCRGFGADAWPRGR